MWDCCWYLQICECHCFRGRASTPIRTITARRSLAPTSHTPLPSGAPLRGVRPPSLWGQWGLPRSTRVPFPRDVGPALPPAVHHLRGGRGRSPDLTAHLLVHACQPLWHVTYHDGSTAVHIRWPYPSTLAPDRLEADSRNLASRLGYPRIKRRLRCPERFAPRGYPRRTAR